MDTDETTTGHGPSAADLPDPDDTLVIERPGSDASFGTYSDLRIIPVEIETTFAIRFCIGESSFNVTKHFTFK